MSKQRITFTRTETVTLELDYKVDPYTRGNVEFWINHGYCGTSPIGKPGQEISLAILLSEWKLLRSEPPTSPAPGEQSNVDASNKRAKLATKKRT